MPKNLLLLRHAESVEKLPGQDDRQRDLTANGMRQAARIGSFLYHEKISVDCIYTSNAIRALRTTEMVIDGMKLPSERIVPTDELYDASTRTFFSFLTMMDDDFSSVMCIGHNPPISYVAEYLTKAEIGDMATAGLVMMLFSLKSWKELSAGTGELIRYIYPEILPE